MVLNRPRKVISNQIVVGQSTSHTTKIFILSKTINILYHCKPSLRTKCERFFFRTNTNIKVCGTKHPGAVSRRTIFRKNYIILKTNSWHQQHHVLYKLLSFNLKQNVQLISVDSSTNLPFYVQ